MATPDTNASPHADVRRTIDAVWRIESARLIAGLVRMVRDVGLAEELAQDALVAALERWPGDGVPGNPGAWLMATAKHRAIDRLRRGKLIQGKHDELAYAIEHQQQDADAKVESSLDDPIGDDLLRLVFIACHPVLSTDAQVALTLRLLGGLTTDEIARAFLVPEPTIAQRIVRAKRTLADAQIALTLREVCGLTTEEIASAFLSKPPTIAQRIVRAKNRIRDERLPYEVPAPAEWPDRLDTVLHTIYLIFNEGYEASSGDDLIRKELCDEAVRLARLLRELHSSPDVDGLLALMLLHQSRANTRQSASGDIILLEDQDRAFWNRDLIAEGTALAQLAFASPPVGSYTIQALIAATHAAAHEPGDTDWRRIVTLYDLLLQAEPGPITELNRAVAIAMRDGPEAGLALIEPLVTGPLATYRFAHAAKADLLRRLGRSQDARVSYDRALALTSQAAEQRFMQKRLAQLS